MASNVFKIEAGEFFLSVVDKSAVGYLETWQAPGGRDAATAAEADYVGATLEGGAFQCQITSGALTASPNTTDNTTAATFCDAEVTTTAVGVTSYTVDTGFLQDPHIVAGLSRFLFEHDTKEAYFLLGLNGGEAPRAIGRCRVIAGQIGGDARVDLTATLSLPVSRKPDVFFGDVNGGEIVGGDGTVTTPVELVGAGASASSFSSE